MTSSSSSSGIGNTSIRDWLESIKTPEYKCGICGETFTEKLEKFDAHVQLCITKKTALNTIQNTFNHVLNDVEKRYTNAIRIITESFEHRLKRSDDTISELREALKHAHNEIHEQDQEIHKRELENHELIDKIDELEEDAKDTEEFFGYQAGSSISEKEELKDKCEEEEKHLREQDPDYAHEAEESDTVADIVIRIGQYQYDIAELFSDLRSSLTDNSQLVMDAHRKVFTSSFDSLRTLFSGIDGSSFYNSIKMFVELQKQIELLDTKLSKE